MQDREYVYTVTEKVLHRARVRVIESGETSGEVDCLITESSLVVASEPVIRIPLSRICDYSYGYSPSGAKEGILQQMKRGFEAESGDELMRPLTIKLKYSDDVGDMRELLLGINDNISWKFSQVMEPAIWKARETDRTGLPVEYSGVGFWRRFVATLVDGLIIGIVFLPNTIWILGVARPDTGENAAENSYCYQ